MKNLIIVAALLSFFPIRAQPVDAVMNVIYDLFRAMETNDSTLAKRLFTDDAILYTVAKGKDGKPMLRSSPASRLVTAFGQPKEQKWTEPIWNERLEIDGDFASVLVDYAFYVDKDFSHCGIDAFHLVNTEKGWKIFHLTDTRRKENCEVPEEVREKYR